MCTLLYETFVFMEKVKVLHHLISKALSNSEFLRDDRSWEKDQKMFTFGENCKAQI